jgi:hypothetical protein
MEEVGGKGGSTNSFSILGGRGITKFENPWQRYMRKPCKTMIRASDSHILPNDKLTCPFSSTEQNQGLLYWPYAHIRAWIPSKILFGQAAVLRAWHIRIGYGRGNNISRQHTEWKILRNFNIKRGIKSVAAPCIKGLWSVISSSRPLTDNVKKHNHLQPEWNQNSTTKCTDGMRQDWLQTAGCKPFQTSGNIHTFLLIHRPQNDTRITRFTVLLN